LYIVLRIAAAVRLRFNSRVDRRLTCRISLSIIALIALQSQAGTTAGVATQI